MLFLIGLIILLALAIFWIYQFVFMMLLGDNTFSGKHDKILWCAVFIVFPMLTPFAFLLWRNVKSGEAKDEVS